jgi:general secretion pathway protein G
MNSQRGFTLIEMLVVLAILGLLAAVATPQVMKHFGRAKHQAVELQMRTIGSALDIFVLDTGRYPTTEEGLAALLRAPATLSDWNGAYLSGDKAIVDPWGKPFFYRSPGEHGEYDLYSYGADGREGGDKDNRDVTNW